MRPLQSFLRNFVRILSYLRGQRRPMALVVAFSALGGGLIILEPLLFARIINDFVDAARAGQGISPRNLIAWAIAGIAANGASLVALIWAERMTQAARYDLMHESLEHVLSLSPSFFERFHPGRVVSVVNQGVSQCFEVWSLFFKEQAGLLAAYVVAVPLSFAMNWRMAIVVLAMSAGFAVANFWVILRTEDSRAESHALNRRLASRTTDMVSNVSVIQSFNAVGAELAAVRETAREILGVDLRLRNWSALMQVATRLSAAITLIATMLVGAWLFRQGQISLGEIVGFIGVANLLIYRLQSTTNFLCSVLTKQQVVDEYFDLMDEAPEIVDRPGAVSLEDLSGEVTFDAVTFAFPGRSPAVSDLSFSVARGSLVGIVGSSGSGKSTVAGLLQRLWDPQCGAIRIGGVDLRDIKLESLRRAMAVVSQEVPLLGRSVRENLLLADPDASLSGLEHVTSSIGAHEFITASRARYETKLGGRGTFSGGERQRIGIARALLKRSAVLILDEATSALDAVSAHKVHEALEGERGKRTIFMITHRLSTLEAADLILVFAAGRLVETGSFEELKARRGRFAAMLDQALVHDGTFPDKDPRVPVDVVSA